MTSSISRVNHSNATMKTILQISLLSIGILTFLSFNFSAVQLTSSNKSHAVVRRGRDDGRGDDWNYEFMPSGFSSRSEAKKSRVRGAENKSFKQHDEKNIEEDFSVDSAESSDVNGDQSVDDLPDESLREEISDDDTNQDTDDESSMDEGYSSENVVPKVGDEGGKIAWLMSFPNSGTSFTSLLVRHASNATTASNYGMECNPGVDGKSVPVYEWSEAGPFWLHPPEVDVSNKSASGIDENENIDQRDNSILPFESGTQIAKSGNYDIPPTSAYIFTKTHCGSRCADCPPKRYLETTKTFLKECLSGSRSVPLPTPLGHENNQQLNSKLIKGKYQKVLTTYHPSLVQKAVHLLRNPFDNLVSRFHHELKEHAKRSDTAKWMKRYPNSVHGFKAWCSDQDTKYYRDEHKVNWEMFGYSDDLLRSFDGVSCHAEFFRYAQWHSLALSVVQMMDIPVLYIYYEDYLTDLEGKTKELLDFLHLPRVGNLPSFDSNKDYSAYFTREERAVASELMRRVARVEGGKLLERYFVSLDFEKMRMETKELN